MDRSKNIKHDINEKEVIDWVADCIDVDSFDRSWNTSFGCKCGRDERDGGVCDIIVWWNTNGFLDEDDEEIDEDHWKYEISKLLLKHNLHRWGGITVCHCATCNEWAVCSHDA